MSVEANLQVRTPTHSALRAVESKIKQFEETAMPFALPEDRYNGTSCLDPRVWANMFCRQIGNGCVDAALRITTFIPTTLIDISVGTCRLDCDQVKDGLVTIPRTCIFLGIDTLKIIGGTAGLICESVVLVGGGACFLVWIGMESCGKCTCDLAGRAIEVIVK